MVRRTWGWLVVSVHQRTNKKTREYDQRSQSSQHADAMGEEISISSAESHLNYEIFILLFTLSILTKLGSERSNCMGTDNVQTGQAQDNGDKEQQYDEK